MGVQINFYIDNELQQDFIRYIYQSDYKIMDCMSANNQLNIYDKFDNVIHLERPFYIVNPFDLNNIFIKSWGQIDPLNSHIIEFITTDIDCKKMKISQGRLWLEKYVYVNNEKTLKSQSLIDMYSSLCKWIKKNTQYTLIGQSKKYVTDKIINLISEGYILA